MVQIAGKEVNLEFMSESIQSNDAMYSSANDLLKYQISKYQISKPEN
jgi:hypothetical protein